MMWLSQKQTPSYKTINRFRINPKIDALLESLFVQFYSHCIEQSLVIIKDLGLKGMHITKMDMVLRESLNCMNVMIMMIVLTVHS